MRGLILSKNLGGILGIPLVLLAIMSHHPSTKWTSWMMPTMPGLLPLFKLRKFTFPILKRQKLSKHCIALTEVNTSEY